MSSLNGIYNLLTSSSVWIKQQRMTELSPLKIIYDIRRLPFLIKNFNRQTVTRFATYMCTCCNSLAHMPTATLSLAPPVTAQQQPMKSRHVGSRVVQHLPRMDNPRTVVPNSRTRTCKFESELIKVGFIIPQWNQLSN